MPDRPRTRVLLVDDSAVVRKLLGDALRKHPDIEVIGGAADPYIARDMILQHEPDVITLDIEMPRMDGLSFLRKLMEHHPIPAIVVSSLTQPGLGGERRGAAHRRHRRDRQAGRTARRRRGGRPRRRAHPRRCAPARRSGSARRAAAGPPATSASIGASAAALRGLIAIGASTGGTQAIETVLTRLPADVPPIVIAQHMPAGFTRAFADRLDTRLPDARRRGGRRRAARARRAPTSRPATTT